MTARRRRRERKENPRYPGSIQYSQEEGEMEAEEPPDRDQGLEEEPEHFPASLTLSHQCVSLLVLAVAKGEEGELSLNATSDDDDDEKEE